MIDHIFRLQINNLKLGIEDLRMDPEGMDTGQYYIISHSLDCYGPFY